MIGYSDLLIGETPRQPYRSLGEVGDILLHVDRIPLRVDAIHVKKPALGLFECRHAYAARKICLIRGVEHPLGDHVHREGLGGGEGGPDGLGIAGRALAEDEQDMLSVGHAVEVDQQGILGDLLVLARKARRAEESHLLQIEEDKGDLAAKLGGEGGHGVQEGSHARGIVVGGVPVGGACHQKIHLRQQKEIPRKEGYFIRKPARFGPQKDAETVHARHDQRGSGQQNHRNEDLVEQINPDALGRDEIGKGHDRAGIVVGGIDDLGGVGISYHDIAGAEIALFYAALIAQLGSGVLDVLFNTPMTSLSTVLAARRMISMWPYVMGSKDPG